MSGAELWTLIRKEILLELRQKYAISGILLFLVSTIFICYLSFNLRSGDLTLSTWNALFWIIVLFTGVNAVAKSFMQDSPGRLMYYHVTLNPTAMIISKVIYYAILMILLSLTGYFFYQLILGDAVTKHFQFLVVIILASTGFSTVLTLISGIASKAGNNPTLMAILSFPVIIPLLLVAIRMSTNALTGLDWSHSQDEILTLAAINMIVLTASYLLFPYLWRS